MLSIVVPVYNELETVDELIRRLSEAVTDLGPYEIVVVDDGSTDGTWLRLAVHAASNPHLRLLRLSRNFGHQLALTAGIDAARGDAVVLIDGDLQDPPEVIPQLVAQWNGGFDVVYGVRERREGESWAKRWTAAMFYRLLRRIAATDIPRDTGDFRLLSRRAVDALRAMPESSRYLRGMSAWIGFRQTGVVYRREPRHAGRTKYSPAKMVRLALDGVTSFSVVPIRLVTGLGFVLVVFCAGVLAWTLYTRLFTNDAVQGWTSMIAVVLLLGGVQLLGIGVVGQYVARIFEETKRRPLYIVEEVVEQVSPDPGEAAPTSDAASV